MSSNPFTRQPGREFSTGVFNVIADVKTCLCGVCCLPCLSCDVARRMDEVPCTPCCGGIPSMRTRLRHVGGIGGSICSDLLWSYLCLPCVTCQMARELKHMGV